MTGLLDRDEPRRRIADLAIMALVSVVLWQTSWGSILLYPFTILATWFHEMGHGFAAIVTGGSFEGLLIYPNGSGVALSLLPVEASVFSHAFVSAAGPLGPPVAGALLILASRSRRATRIALVVLASALLLTTLVWVRSLVGWIVLPILGLLILAIAGRGSAKLRDFAIQALGVQACISTYQHSGYLFTEGGVIGGRAQRSDTAAIADSLLLPYWFWGGAISLVILALLGTSLWLALRSPRRRPWR